MGVKVMDRAAALGGAFVPREDDGLVVCRCEEVTRGEIRRAVHDGMADMSELRRFLRCGMGLCQGQTCGRLVRGILARELGVGVGEVGEAAARGPMRPTEMRVVANEEGGWDA
jgi:bacterioferritin-associated ferredoxin